MKIQTMFDVDNIRDDPLHAAVAMLGGEIDVGKMSEIDERKSMLERSTDNANTVPAARGLYFLTIDAS